MGTIGGAEMCYDHHSTGNEQVRKQVFHQSGQGITDFPIDKMMPDQQPCHIDGCIDGYQCVNAIRIQDKSRAKLDNH